MVCQKSVAVLCKG